MLTFEGSNVDSFGKSVEKSPNILNDTCIHTLNIHTLQNVHEGF